MAAAGENEPEAKEGGEAKPAPAPGSLNVSASPSLASLKRGATLRRELLAKLPPLPVAGDAAGALRVDPNAVDLDADAFVGPLAALVSEGKG